MEIYLNDNRELKEGILNDIRNTDDICSYIDAAIKELKGVVKKFNPSENFLGVNVPLNKKVDLENNDNYLIGNFYWYSFIDSDVKVIYGFQLMKILMFVMMDYIIILMTMSIYMTLLDLLKIKRLEMILTFYVM